MTLETGRLSWFGQAMKIYPSDFRFKVYFISPFTKHHSRKRWLAQRCSLWKHSILAEFLLHDSECWKNIKVFPQKKTHGKKHNLNFATQKYQFWKKWFLTKISKSQFWNIEISILKYRNLNFACSMLKSRKTKKLIPKYRNLNFFECAQFYLQNWYFSKISKNGWLGLEAGSETLEQQQDSSPCQAKRTPKNCFTSPLESIRNKSLWPI